MTEHADFITEKLRQECQETYKDKLMKTYYINPRGEIVEYTQEAGGPSPSYTSSEQEALDIQFIIGQVVLSGATLTIQIDYPEGAPEWSATATVYKTHDGGQTIGDYEGVGPSLRAALMALHSDATGSGQPLQLQPIPPPFGVLPQNPEYEPDPRD